MASNNVKAPPYPKTKYTDAKFRDIIPTLPLAECLKIEYRAKGIWFKMISKHAINRYNCECCGIDNIGPMPILDHLRGKKHRLALQVAEKLYHPQYTVAKPTKSPGRTPILDAFTEKEQSFDKSKTKPGPLSSKTKPGPASKPAAPASANAQKSNTDKSNQKPGSDKPNQKPGPASSKKPTNAAVTNNKAAAPTKTTGENAAAKPANVGDTKANTETAKDNNKANDAKESSAEKQNDDTNASGDAKANESKTNDAKPDDGKVSVEKSSETKVGEEKAADTAVDKNEVKQDELKSDDGAKPNDNEVTVVKEFSNEVPEIVILDDDDDDLPASNQSKAKEPAVEAQGKAIPVANTAVPKNQRPPKRGTLNAQQQTQQFPIQQPPAGQIPPADCIINPAAVLAQAASSGDAATTENEKPRYQQNRVIVPTNNRKRGQESSSSNQNKKSSEPNFSKKTFSTKVDAANDIEGIIGVEYVVKILKVYNDPEPFYECCLCEVVMDGTGMQSHLLGYNHRYKYLEKHFPTVFNQQKDHMGNIQVMSFIFERLAKAIEAHHGRELPYECLSGEFRSNRHGVMTTVYSFRHASEYSGPSFTNVIDKKEVDELYQKRLVYNPPKPDPKRKPTFDTRVSVGAPPAAKRGRVEPERPTRNIHGRGRGYRQEPEQNLPVDDATHKLMVEEFLNHTRGKSRSPSSRGGRGRRHRSRSRSRSPHRSSHRRRSVSPLREGDIWQAYRHLVDRSKTELDQMYREYRKDPEKHPNYDEEWRKFWKHRKDQLTREGLDHRNYDFQPEWVRYFAVRIEELYEEAVEDIKISARRRLILPMTNDELKDKKYHVKVATEHESEPQHDHHRARPEADQHRSDNQQQFAIREEKTSVVSVLRLLTALEDYLGSLGPKMVDLLSRALLVEKTNPGDVNEIILNLENCTTLETAMEKLKGVLIAGLLEGPKVKAFNNVITETDKILRIAYKMRRDNPQVAAAHKMAQQRQELPQQQPMVPAPGSQNTMGPGGAAGAGAAANLLSQIDKKELATKLAAALTAQGKTDFNPEQLQQLIAVYSLIDKKKRDSAAATDKQKMTLSDTLTALLNPKGSGGDGGGNFSNMNSDKFSPVNNSSISNFVSMLNNGNSSMGGGGKGGDSEMWQNLQNIQTSLRLQNNPATNANVGGGGGAGGGMAIGGFGNNPGNSGRGFGNANQMGGVGGGGGSNFNRGGGYGGGGGGGGDNRGGYPSMDSLEAGFRSGYQGGVNNSNPTRGGGDDMITGGRGVNDMMGGGQRGADMISRGRVGPGQGGNSGGGNSYNSRMGSTGTGANNTLGFSRTSYLGGGAAPNSNYNFPGLSNFSTSITAAPLNSNFSRMGGGSNNNNMGSGGGGGGGAVGGGNNMGGGNFNRNANTNFNSGQNQRNNSRGLGSNWKNQ